MSEKVTPRVDIAFKKLFGVEENKDLLISLINSIVSKEDQVSDVDLLNPYNPKNFKRDKLSILDIKAKCSSGKHYNIEIQVSDEEDYDKRALLYWAKLYSGQLEQSMDYSKLNKTIGIHILNFISIPSIEKYHNVFNLREKDSNLHHFKDIELHTIELRKFENKAEKLDESEEINMLLKKIKTSLDRWVAFLTRHDLLSKEGVSTKLKDPNVQKALDVLEVMNFSKQEREAYEDHLKWLRVEANTLKKAENKAFIKGEAKGIEKGMEKERIAIINNMLASNISIDTISKATKLSPSEIEKLKRDKEH